jgi:hypothetical protein
MKVVSPYGRVIIKWALSLFPPLFFHYVKSKIKFYTSSASTPADCAKALRSIFRAALMPASSALRFIVSVPFGILESRAFSRLFNETAWER